MLELIYLVPCCNWTFSSIPIHLVKLIQHCWIRWFVSIATRHQINKFLHRWIQWKCVDAIFIRYICSVFQIIFNVQFIVWSIWMYDNVNTKYNFNVFDVLRQSLENESIPTVNGQLEINLLWIRLSRCIANLSVNGRWKAKSINLRFIKQ